MNSTTYVFMEKKEKILCVCYHELWSCGDSAWIWQQDHMPFSNAVSHPRHTKVILPSLKLYFFWLIVLGFNDTSTLVDHSVSSPWEREKRDRRISRRAVREGQGRKRNRNESEETEGIKHSPSTLTCYKDSRPCPTVSQYQLEPGDIRYTTPSPHPTTPTHTILTIAPDKVFFSNEKYWYFSYFSMTTLLGTH